MSSFADHFSSLANAYASSRPHYPTALFEYLSSLCPRHELAWDCAAGSGQATLPLARYFSRVLGTDASGAMLAQAPSHPKVEYRVAPAEASGLAPAGTDLVTVAQALHWLDLDRFYPEADRVLAPGGILAVWSYGVQLIENGDVNRLLQRFYNDVVGPYWAPARRHVEAGYRTLRFPYPELDPPEFVMEERWTLAELLGYVGTWSATERFRQVHNRDPLDDLTRDLAPAWGNIDLARPVRWPLSLRLGAKPT